MSLGNGFPRFLRNKMPLPSTLESVRLYALKVGGIMFLGTFEE